MLRLDLVRERIVFARGYTLRLLEQTKADDWFRQPAAGVTHIAWQVGHLAMAQYRLALERIRGPRADDEALVSQDFLRTFGIKSVPQADASLYPAASEIRTVFDRLHDRVLAELRMLKEEVLDEPVAKAHSLARTKFDSLLWCAQHEGVHAGQIGLIRRQLGYPPIW
jgi:uncharacterized damage-inducible protein DinB